MQHIFFSILHSIFQRPIFSSLTRSGFEVEVFAEKYLRIGIFHEKATSGPEAVVPDIIACKS